MSNTVCCVSLWKSADREYQALDILAGLPMCECTFWVLEQEAGLGWAGCWQGAASSAGGIGSRQ